MAVRIIRDSERNKFEYDGSTFYYRRVSMQKSMEIQKRHSKRGVINHVASGLEMMQWALLDWEHVEDEDGQEIAFSKDLIENLPDEIVNAITPLLREASPEQADMGNSDAS